MARSVLPRNEIGQFIGDIPDKVGERTAQFAKELFKEFPDVDLWDLECIVFHSFPFQASLQMLAEAAENNNKEEE